MIAVHAPMSRLGSLRDLLDPKAAARAARAAVPCLARGELLARSVEAERLDVDDAGCASLTLLAHVRDPRRGRVGTRPILVRAGSSPDRAGVDGLVGTQGDLTFWLSPADPRLTDLAERLAPSRLAPWLAAAGVRLPGAWTPALRVDVLAHRFGRRAMARVDTCGSPRVVGLKFSARPDAAGRLAVEALSAASAVRTPRLLFADGPRRLFAWMRGTSLHASGDRVTPDALEAVGRTVAALAIPPPAALPVHDVTAELENARRLARRAAVVDADLAGRIEAALDARIPSAAEFNGPFVLTHRDLHDKQVILARGRPGILDWDLAASAPRGLDAGNFLAHLTLRVLQGRLAPARAAAWRDAFLQGWTAARPFPATALRFWEGLALVRLAAVYALRPPWFPIAAELLAASDIRRSRS